MVSKIKLFILLALISNGAYSQNEIQLLSQNNNYIMKDKRIYDNIVNNNKSKNEFFILFIKI